MPGPFAADINDPLALSAKKGPLQKQKLQRPLAHIKALFSSFIGSSLNIQDGIKSRLFKNFLHDFVDVPDRNAFFGFLLHHQQCAQAGG